jgi:hypothetical protein
MNRTSLNELHQACLYPQTCEILFPLPILIPLHIARRSFGFYLFFSQPDASPVFWSRGWLNFFFDHLGEMMGRKVVAALDQIQCFPDTVTHSGDEAQSVVCLGGSCFV